MFHDKVKRTQQGNLLRDSGKDYHFNMRYRQDVRKDEVDDDGDDNYHSNMSHGQDIRKDEGEEVLDF